MRSSVTTGLALACLMALAAAGAPALAADVDADAAQALIKKNDCGKCHSLDREKKAPSWKKIASKNKGKPDIEEKFIKHLTTSPKVKLDDGTEEEHKAINTKDVAAIKNLIAWVLSR
ncbi:MAG: cytochrome C [Rubrivivax sp.]|nr:cytochrome C [Rubrivivax sp.]